MQHDDRKYTAIEKKKGSSSPKQSTDDISKTKPRKKKFDYYEAARNGRNAEKGNWNYFITWLFNKQRFFFLRILRTI